VRSFTGVSVNMLDTTMRDRPEFLSRTLAAAQKVGSWHRKFPLPEGEEKISPDFLGARQDWGGFGSMSLS